MVGKIIGQGDVREGISPEAAREIVQAAADALEPQGKRILVLIPDGTRSGPIPFFFRELVEALGGRVKQLDFLVALGTHPAMSESALLRLVGITPEERATRYARVGLFNHRWDLSETFTTLGVFSQEDTGRLSQGMLSVEVPVRLNRKVLEYDHLLVCGPVFPHEVVGFSGGNKYFFPGISGPEVINFTHWLGALITSAALIGTMDTPVRAAIDRAANLIPTPRSALCFVVAGDRLLGLYFGKAEAAWRDAARLSAQAHIRYVERPFERVLSVLPPMYDDIWTGAKGMYKVEPVVADGGEVTILSPHISEISYTHGQLIDEIGYHVRDYFVAQWERFKGYPWGVLAHSTHLRGSGSYLNGVERPRIQVTLATHIPRERCEKVCLGYRNPGTIDPAAWAGLEDEGVLLVPHAGELLFRLKGEEPADG